MPRILLEVCCGSLEDAVAAEQGGADRIELCAALCVGGLTPSLGTIHEAKARLRIPIMVIVRPRGAGFHYGPSELAVMERDTELALAQGADGIVLGALREDGSLDVEACRRLRHVIGDRQAVFHRAFDVTPDPVRALQELIGLGFTRVLTSGQRTTAVEGAATLKRLIDQAGDRIEILPGGGIRIHNVRQIVSETGCRQVHLTAFRTQTDSSTQARPELSFLGEHPPPDQYKSTDPQLVREIVRELASGRPTRAASP